MRRREAAARVRETLSEIARVYPRGMHRYLREHRPELRAGIADAEQAVKAAVEAGENREALDTALDGLRWAYASAISVYRAACEVPHD